jgi:hypothetical protein
MSLSEYRRKRRSGRSPSHAVGSRGDVREAVAGLSSMPGNGFEASAVLADPHQAGMQVSIRWPSAAKVHCEVDVDDNVATQVDQFVQPAAGSTDPTNGVLPCGAPLPAT